MNIPNPSPTQIRDLMIELASEGEPRFVSLFEDLLSKHPGWKKALGAVYAVGGWRPAAGFAICLRMMERVLKDMEIGNE